jgi:hypothetical protein
MLLPSHSLWLIASSREVFSHLSEKRTRVDFRDRRLMNTSFPYFIMVELRHSLKAEHYSGASASSGRFTALTNRVMTMDSHV